MGCIKFSVVEEYKVAKRGRECQKCGEEYNVEKKERGSNIFFPFILRLFGSISSWEERGGRGLKN